VGSFKLAPTGGEWPVVAAADAAEEGVVVVVAEEAVEAVEAAADDDDASADMAEAWGDVDLEGDGAVFGTMKLGMGPSTGAGGRRRPLACAVCASSCVCAAFITCAMVMGGNTTRGGGFGCLRGRPTGRLAHGSLGFFTSCVRS
jgi:hypothetical protein